MTTQRMTRTQASTRKTGSPRGDAGVDALATRFAAALDAVGGITHHADDVAAAREEVARLCAGRPVVADRDAVLEPLLGDLHQVSDPWEAQVGLTTAAAAAAETGTLVLPFDADHPRRTGLVPPVHVAVVPTDRLVSTYQDAVDHLATLRPLPSGVRFATGPSSSGDIELTFVRGMHGPVELHVVLVGTGSSTAPDTQERP